MPSVLFARLPRALIAVLTLALATFALNTPVHAAAAAGCEGGGFRITNLADGSTVGGDQTTTIAASRLGPRFVVKGTYVEFTVVARPLESRIGR